MANSIFSSWCYPRVERMKIPKHILIPIIISLVLFIIPFFWFKPGEMDLGGDSSRLYFYDPMSYLVKSALYVISPSSFGFENRNYISLPFVTLLILLKSIISSPTILISAFYGFSLSMLFLILYTKFILKKKIVVKHIILGFFLFIGVQVFHIVPQIITIFSKGSDINSTIFSDKGKFDRGLSYFSAIAPNIKASINLFVLPQMKILSSFSNAFFIFPFVIVTAFFFNRKKTILLTAFFFLIVLFFVTANITNVGLSFYKSLFSIPGFSMFRNFGGQWQYTYIFFYSILFGQALYVLLNKARNIYIYLFASSLILILVINAIPLIKGDFAREILWQSNNIEAIIQMDPDYEKVLSFVRSLPADG